MISNRRSIRASRHKRHVHVQSKRDRGEDFVDSVHGALKMIQFTRSISALTTLTAPRGVIRCTF